MALARVPRGCLTLLAGDPGLGKSTWTSRLAALASRGECGRKRGVLVVTAEDSVSQVVVPRALAAGADLGFLRAVYSVRRRGREGLFTLADHALLRQEIGRPCK